MKKWYYDGNAAMTLAQSARGRWQNTTIANDDEQVGTTTQRGMSTPGNSNDNERRYQNVDDQRQTMMTNDSGRPVL